MTKRIYKLWISLVVAMVLLVNIILPDTAFAASPDLNETALPTANGRIVFDNGMSQVLEAKVVSIQKSGMSNENLAVTYRYDIPKSLMASGSTSVEEQDGGMVSTVTLTIYYTTRNTPKEYLLTKVSGQWDIRDSRTRIESAKISYGCSGIFPSPTTQNVVNRSISVSRNSFSINTGFTDYVTSELYSVLGAHLTLNYLMGTARRWSFTLDNVLFNN